MSKINNEDLFKKLEIDLTKCNYCGKCKEVCFFTL